jgi:hypothetical protein
MTKMMETLESRQMFSVSAVEPAALPGEPTVVSVDTADTEVVVAKGTKPASALMIHCCSGQHIKEGVVAA